MPEFASSERSPTVVLSETPVTKLEFKELRSCCGTLYGYMDQYGRKYNLQKELVEDLESPD